MKKSTLALLTGSILLSLTTNFAVAQSNSMAVNHKINYALPIVFEASTGVVNENTVRVNDVNVKAVRNFKKDFTHAINVNWFKTTEGFTAYSYQNENKVRTAYDTKGNLLYNMITYSEGQLPRDIWHMVKSNYYDYSIVIAHEIQKHDKIIYIVHIENSSSARDVRIFEGEMEVISQVNKN